MAGIRLGALAQDVRGTVGDLVYSRNRSGPFVRARSTKPLATSDWRTIVQAGWNETGRMWREDLSEAQRDSWRIWAAAHPLPNKLGGTSILCAYSAYQQIRMRLYILGSYAPSAAPSTWAADDLGKISCYGYCISGGPYVVITCSSQLGINSGLWIYATPPIPQRLKLSSCDFGLCNLVNRALFPNPVTLQTEISARWPAATWSVGDRLAFRIASIQLPDGCMSQLQQTECILGAP